jgi:SAM-dependent methyltransferase
MRLAHKLRKLFDPRTIRSAKQHIGRVFLTRRFVFRLDAQRIIDSIDRKKFQTIHDRHAVENPGAAWPKYLDLQRWIGVNLRRVEALDLDYGRRRRVLDIGSGAGYFLYICKWLGHDAVGLDIDEVPMYPEMTRLLGLKRIVWRIEAFTPLPDLGENFDVITAFMICFNNHHTRNLWGVAEWDFFLDDIATRLRPGGKIWLELNPQRDGTFMTDELRELFDNRGAHVERHRIIFNQAPRASALAAPTVR